MRIKYIFSTAIQLASSTSYPSCINCKHYIPSTLSDTLPKCKLFGYKDKTLGVILNHYTSTCRKSSNMCGEEGYYFIQKKI
jgi:hypothetical protein